MDYPASVVNSYIYVMNNPATWTDPSGKLIWFLAIPLIFAAAGAISGGIWAALQPNATLGSILTGMGLGALGGLIGGVGAVAGLFAAAAIIGVPAGMSIVAAGGALIGTTAGVLAAGLGAGITGAVWGGITGGPMGALAGFVFGFAGGAITGGGVLPSWVDLGTNVIVSAPPVPVPPRLTTSPTPLP